MNNADRGIKGNKGENLRVRMISNAAYVLTILKDLASNWHLCLLFALEMALVELGSCHWLADASTTEVIPPSGVVVLPDRSCPRRLLSAAR